MRKPLRAHGFAQVRDGRRIAEKISKAHVLSLEHCWESLPRLRMEVSIRQHLEELLLGALVDTVADQVAFAVEHECSGSAIDVEESVDLAIRVDEHRRGDRKSTRLNSS